MQRTVLFLNLGHDPAIKRIIMLQLALMTMEYLAHKMDLHVLVCPDGHELAHGRVRHMHTSLSTIYEQAGGVMGRNKSIKQLPSLPVPNKNITHLITGECGWARPVTSHWTSLALPIAAGIKFYSACVNESWLCLVSLYLR